MIPAVGVGVRQYARVMRSVPPRLRRACAPAARAAPVLRPLAPALWSLLLALVVAGPLLGPGYLLLRDAVSTPRSYVTDAALGVSGAAPRAVPQDVVVALLSSVVDGGAVVTAVVVLALWAAGAGASAMTGALVPAHRGGLAARFVAATLAVWNPYVAERLLQGHWSLLTGYAALPWLVWAGVRWRRRPREGAAVTLLALACAGLTPTGAVLALLVALPVAALPGGWRRGVRVAVVCAGFVAVAAPWLVAAAVSSGGGSDPAGVDAFAARAETALGTLGSLAGLGGIWNAQAVPGSRAGWGAAAGTVVLLAVVACGLRGLWRRRGHPVIVTVVVLAVAAVLLPALAATPPGLAAGRWAVQAVPGAGLLRDAQKWVALAMPGYALAAALGTRALAARLRPSRAGHRGERGLPRRPAGRGAGIAAAGCMAALLIGALPSLAWGVGGALRPVHYPPAWDAVARILGAAPHAGSIVTLPAGSFRRFPWTHGPVLDPAPRYFRPEVLAPGTLQVGGVTIDGEGGRALRAQQALLAGASPKSIAALGVRWALVQHNTPGGLGDSSVTLAGLDPVYADGDLSLYLVRGTAPPPHASTAERGWAWAGHGLYFATGAAGLALAGAELRARRRAAARC